MADRVFAALSDPTRRGLFTQLARGGPQTATSLASDLSISRQAVSKHLHVLADAGMASATRVGRETRYEASMEPLDEVSQWIRNVEGQWSQRLAALNEALGSRPSP